MSRALKRSTEVPALRVHRVRRGPKSLPCAFPSPRAAEFHPTTQPSFSAINGDCAECGRSLRLRARSNAVVFPECRERIAVGSRRMNFVLRHSPATSPPAYALRVAGPANRRRDAPQICTRWVRCPSGERNACGGVLCPWPAKPRNPALEHPIRGLAKPNSAPAFSASSATRPSMRCATSSTEWPLLYRGPCQASTCLLMLSPFCTPSE
jgi:hypothetical protein